jgi:hypothetical protein
MTRKTLILALITAAQNWVSLYQMLACKEGLSGLMCHTLRRKVIRVMANSYNGFPTEGEKP